MAVMFQRGQLAPLLRRPMGALQQPQEQPFGLNNLTGQPQAMDLQQPMPSPQPQPKQGGGLGWGILGAIGDALQTAGGGHATFTPMLQQQQQEEQQARAALEAQRVARQQKWDDTIALKQWERDNPAPMNNDTVNDYQFISAQLGEEAAKQYLRTLGDPTVTVQLPGNRVYSGPRSGLSAALSGGTAPAQPEKPVGKLTPITGGGGGNATGGFRP